MRPNEKLDLLGEVNVSFFNENDTRKELFSGLWVQSPNFSFIFYLFQFLTSLLTSFIATEKKNYAPRFFLIMASKRAMLWKEYMSREIPQSWLPRDLFWTEETPQSKRMASLIGGGFTREGGMPPSMVDYVSTRKMWEVSCLLSSGRVVSIDNDNKSTTWVSLSKGRMGLTGENRSTAWVSLSNRRAGSTKYGIGSITFSTSSTKDVTRFTT
jgi:hypothetical protein